MNVPPFYLTISGGNSFCGAPFAASCLCPMVVEPVLLGSLGGQSLLPKETGFFNRSGGGGGGL